MQPAISADKKIAPVSAASHVKEASSALRNRRAAASAVSAIFAKGVTVGAMIVSVPITLAYLGPQRYGWWLTLSAAVFAFSFADLGIGNALINQVAHTNGKENQRAVHKVISTAARVRTKAAQLSGEVS
ncbi:MAG TPA: hypothetical protein VJY15_07425 [Candidatus Acidoferrum sp.]|nr:hypothetical protein [Candidatus Acidoferrum sp.]